jgi:flavin-dependent dehydrogenase
MAHLERHAIVMGASMSGLLAARALADHYSSVTVIERDEFPAECEPRKGVPQARQVHGLLTEIAAGFRCRDDKNDCFEPTRTSHRPDASGMKISKVSIWEYDL